MKRVLRRVSGSGEDRMAYVLLAFGALLMVIGVYAVITGYPIVQIEEGWASVIAGATLISGGAISMALALVLWTLVKLRSDLRLGAASHAPAVAPQPDQVAIPPLATPVFAENEAPSLTGPLADPLPRDATAPHHDASHREAIEHNTDEAAALRQESSGAQPVDEAQHGEADPSEFRQPSLEAQPFTAAPSPDPLPFPEPDLPPPPPPLRRPVLSRLIPSRPVPQPPAPPAPETVVEPPVPIPAPAAPPASPPAEDWLDRAFAEVDTQDRGVADTLRRLDAANPAFEASTTVPDHIDAPSPEPAHALATHEVPRAEPPPPPPSPDPAGGATAAVIGRYESDGTSYVMYADGSIEAHTESGVYRFASMAELKTFIER